MRREASATKAATASHSATQRMRTAHIAARWKRATSAYKLYAPGVPQRGAEGVQPAASPSAHARRQGGATGRLPRAPASAGPWGRSPRCRHAKRRWQPGSARERARALDAFGIEGSERPRFASRPAVDALSAARRSRVASGATRRASRSKSPERASSPIKQSLACPRR